jgi:hypothetical protein
MIHFQNPDKTSRLRREITKQELSDWTKSKRLNGAPPPPKSLAGVRRQWSLRAWLEWFEKYMLWSDEFRSDAIAADAGKTTGAMPMGELEQVTKRERLELERFQMMVEMGHHIAVPKVEQQAAGFSRKYHDQWKVRVEKFPVEAFVTKMQSLGVESEKISVLEQFLIEELRKVTDEVELASEKFAVELAEQLEQEIQRERTGA